MTGDDEAVVRIEKSDGAEVLRGTALDRTGLAGEPIVQRQFTSVREPAGSVERDERGAVRIVEALPASSVVCLVRQHVDRQQHLRRRPGRSGSNDESGHDVRAVEHSVVGLGNVGGIVNVDAGLDVHQPRPRIRRRDRLRRHGVVSVADSRSRVPLHRQRCRACRGTEEQLDPVARLARHCACVPLHRHWHPVP